MLLKCYRNFNLITHQAWRQILCCMSMESLTSVPPLLWILWSHFELKIPSKDRCEHPGWQSVPSCCQLERWGDFRWSELKTMRPLNHLLPNLIFVSNIGWIKLKIPGLWQNIWLIIRIWSALYIISTVCYVDPSLDGSQAKWLQQTSKHFYRQFRDNTRLDATQ